MPKYDRSCRFVDTYKSVHAQMQFNSKTITEH